jgi:hypothetical protein
MNRKIFVVAAAVAAFALPGLAQDSKLNGTWKLDVAKSSFGQFPPPTSEIDTITVKGNSFKQEYTSVSARGTQNVMRSCDVDGKEVENPDTSQVNLGGNFKLAKMQCSWDGKSVVFLETVNMQGGVLTDKLTFTPSADGSTMTLTGHIESANAQLNGDRKYVYDKSDASATSGGSPAAPTPGNSAIFHASTQPNLTGTWKLNISKSSFGQIPPPASQTDTIEDNEPNVKVTEDQKGGMMGDMNLTTTLNTAGQETTSAGMGGAEVKSTAHWDGGTLVVNSKTSFQGSDITIKDSYTVSGDGSTLTEVTHIESGMGNFDTTSVYDKQ